MTDKQIINNFNPEDFLDPYKYIPACEIKDCNELIYCGDGILGCRISPIDTVCDDFNNPDQPCLYRQLEYYKEALKSKEQECEKLKEEKQDYCFDCDVAERMRAVTYAATGGRLSYANYTVEAIEQAYHDQLRIDVEHETKELEQQLDNLKQTLGQIKELIESEYCIDLESCKFCGNMGDCLNQQILQKISECEVE